MATRNETVQVRLPTKTVDQVSLIAKTAGVSFNSVVRVMVAIEILRLDEARNKDKQKEVSRVTSGA